MKDNLPKDYTLDILEEVLMQQKCDLEEVKVNKNPLSVRNTLENLEGFMNTKYFFSRKNSMSQV